MLQYEGLLEEEGAKSVKSLRPVAMEEMTSGPPQLLAPPAHGRGELFSMLMKLLFTAEV